MERPIFRRGLGSSPDRRRVGIPRYDPSTKGQVHRNLSGRENLPGCVTTEPTSLDTQTRDAVCYLQPVREVCRPHIHQPSGRWRAEPDHAECTLQGSCGRGLYSYPIRHSLQPTYEIWNIDTLVDLTIGNVILHPGSRIDLQFSGLSKKFRISRWDVPKRYVHPQAINTGISGDVAEEPWRYSLHGVVYHIFAGLHHPRNPWDCLCVLSVAVLSG